MNDDKEGVITLKPLSSVRPAKKPRKPKKPKSTSHNDHIPPNASPSKPITVLKRPVQEKPVEILQSPPTTSASTPIVVSSRSTAAETKISTGHVLPPTPAPTPTSTKPTPTVIRVRTEPQIVSKSLDNRPQTAPSTSRNATPGQKKRDRLNRGRRKSDSYGPMKESVVRNHNETNQSDNGPNKVDELAKKISPIDENEPINEAELPYLQSEYVYPLKKKSNRFTRAVYFCRLCDHHINTLIQAKHHIACSDHKVAKEEKVLISLLASIPNPTQAHCEALNTILKLTAEKNGRSAEHLENCEQVVEILTALVKQRISPECYVRMYGSCASGFALKSSNLNLELMYPDSHPKLNHATALMKCYFLIYETKNLFSDVQKDFCHKWPFIKFSVNMGKFFITDVVLSVRNTQAYEVSQFLKTYTDAFPRLKTIGHVWRHWAKICDLDNFQNGGLPSYAFDLMLVHYLQQCQPPFLPVLHELDLTDEEKKEKNVYQKDVEKIRRAVAETYSKEWSYAEIFIGVLRYYTVGNDYQAFVVNVRSKTEVSRETKGWNKKRLAVEDPFMPFKNLAQLSNDMYTYFMRCLQNSYKYFGIPQTFSGPLFFYDNRKLVLSWYNDAASGGQPANRTNSAVMMPPHVVRPTTTLGRENSMDVEKNAAERSFQVVFNSNARNVPANQSSTDGSMVSSRLVKSVAKSSSAEPEPINAGRRPSSSAEDPETNETSPNSVSGDDRPGRKHRSKQRTVRNFCIKKLTGMDDKCAENNHPSEHCEKNDDGETPPFLIETVDESLRYDRGTILQLAKQCLQTNRWPDQSILNSYRVLFNFPKSKNLTFNYVAEDKLGWSQIERLLNGVGVDATVEINRVLIRRDIDNDLDDEPIDQNRDRFTPSHLPIDVSPSPECDGDEFELVTRPVVPNSDENFVQITVDEEFENLHIDDDCCACPIRKCANLETRETDEHENGCCDGESNFIFPSPLDIPLEHFLDDKELIREVKIDESFEESKVRRDTVSSDDSQVEFQNENDDSDPVQQPLSAEIDSAVVGRYDSQDQRDKEAEMMDKFDVDVELCSAASLLKLTDYTFEFEFFCFKNELTKPRVQCDSCRMWNHLAPYCPNPEKELPPLRFLPQMTTTYMDLQTFFVQSVFNYNRLSAKRVKFQEEFRQELEKRLRQIWPNSSLYLFGSSCNGFGFTHSDLDICLTFDNKSALPEGVDPVKIIKKIARMMHQQTDFCDIFPVTRAKVPIVRFYHRESKLEGDISLYNILALRNTQLLYTYSMIDPRVQPLGYMAKVFAKQCDIGDASKGSLSSYAYVLMVIHYLQRRTPPVLPILQQIQVDPKRPQKFMVDGWDTYFYSDLNNLPKIWKGYRKNKESIGELWLGFLIYYTEKFDPRNDVVQIRQSTPLTKFEKLWTDRPLAIEDPFDLNHNLASGLSKKMFLYIIKAFRRARDVFGDPIHEQKIYKRFLNDLFYENLGFYFFCVALQFNEPPPKDRVCKLCERVGHFVENCPMKRSNKGKWMDEMFFDDDDDLDDTEATSPMTANENETNRTIVFENSLQYARTQSHPGLETNDKAMPKVPLIVCPTVPMMPYQTSMMPQSAPILKATSTMMPGMPYSWNSTAVPSMHAYHQQSSAPITSFSPSQHTMAPKTLTSPYYMVNHQRK